jgi:hypothetical protein
MHQYKTAAQILLILSIFNLVLAAPVVREIYDARDDQAVPTAVRNVAVVSKERHQFRSDEATASPSSTPPDVSMTSHSSPPLPGGPPRLSASSPPDMNEWLSAWLATHLDPPTSSDGGDSLHELPTHPNQPTSSGISSPGEIVPATDHPVGVPWPSTFESASTRERYRFRAQTERAMLQRIKSLLTKSLGGLAFIGVTAGVVALYRHLHPHRRAIDPDWYVSNPSRPCCRRLNVPNHKRSDLRDPPQLNS